MPGRPSRSGGCSNGHSRTSTHWTRPDRSRAVGGGHRRAGGGGAGRVHRPDLQPDAGPGRILAPAGAQVPGLATARVPDRGLVLDVESGGLDLEQRSQGSNWQAAAGAGIPRDGGMADLLRAARSPEPPFAFVICEDIERSARDNYNSLKLERRLRDEGIAIFATDEPFSVQGVNATTILVRRVKQGVAEWYRLQLKEKVWEGLKEHNYDGWNIGPVPYGYVPERHTHPNPMKAAAGRTKTRLATDPARGPVITTIYQWRVRDQLGVPTIRARLNASPGLYAPPDPDRGWTLAGLYKILTNPKYTGYQVLGRTHHASPTRRVEVPPDQWIWSALPTHPALVR